MIKKQAKKSQIIDEVEEFWLREEELLVNKVENISVQNKKLPY